MTARTALDVDTEARLPPLISSCTAWLWMAAPRNAGSIGMANEYTLVPIMGVW